MDLLIVLAFSFASVSPDLQDPRRVWEGRRICWIPAVYGKDAVFAGSPPCMGRTPDLLDPGRVWEGRRICWIPAVYGKELMLTFINFRIKTLKSKR